MSSSLERVLYCFGCHAVLQTPQKLGGIMYKQAVGKPVQDPDCESFLDSLVGINGSACCFLGVLMDLIKPWWLAGVRDGGFR